MRTPREELQTSTIETILQYNTSSQQPTDSLMTGFLVTINANPASNLSSCVIIALSAADIFTIQEDLRARVFGLAF